MEKVEGLSRELLEPNIDGSEPGSTTEDMVYGLNWYFRWRGISSNYQALVTHSAPFSYYRPIIDSGRPVIVDLDAHPTYGEHWVVGYGYTIEPHLGNTYYYIVANDGIKWSGDLHEICGRYCIFKQVANGWHFPDCDVWTWDRNLDHRMLRLR